MGRLRNFLANLRRLTDAPVAKPAPAARPVRPRIQRFAFAGEDRTRMPMPMPPVPMRTGLDPDGALRFRDFEASDPRLRAAVQEYISRTNRNEIQQIAEDQ